jgi:hypothetical protein
VTKWKSSWPRPGRREIAEFVEHDEVEPGQEIGDASLLAWRGADLRILRIRRRLCGLLVAACRSRRDSGAPLLGLAPPLVYLAMFAFASVAGGLVAGHRSTRKPMRVCSRRRKVPTLVYRFPTPSTAATKVFSCRDAARKRCRTRAQKPCARRTTHERKRVVQIRLISEAYRHGGSCKL